MRMYKKGQAPPNPRPGSYILVVTKEGSYWRLKRGTIKKATVNAAYAESIARMKISAPAASRLVRKLQPYMNGLHTGRLNARISALFRKSLSEKGQLSLQYLNDFDFQKEHPLEHLLQEQIAATQTHHEVIITIPVHAGTIKKFNRLITDYYFELVLLYGNVAKDQGLRTESVESAVYAIAKDYKKPCTLRMVLPDQPWIALLKVNSFEGNQPSVHPKLYGLKVVAAGE